MGRDRNFDWLSEMVGLIMTGYRARVYLFRETFPPASTSSLSPSIFSSIGSGNTRGHMGGERRRILVGLAVAMFLGLVVYLRLWTIDYSMSSDEAELLRRQFDLANREAMDESAEWRRLYDNELDRANKCNSELNKLKESFEKVEDAARINQKLTKMQEENIALREQVDALKRKVEAEKSRCGSQ